MAGCFQAPSNTGAAVKGPAQRYSPRHFIAFCTADLLTRETEVIYTTSLILQAPHPRD